ncbi:hypothetical protein PIB30_052152 [Stylosanthes scabra]|uniref:Uncharacterized protein n=1 Tax=Stylosanthes scabra TaxID=79078 RepID=A0ABU6ZGW9_9FABA|nr:hypothetical protein [Stylosanthes scabra]
MEVEKGSIRYSGALQFLSCLGIGREHVAAAESRSMGLANKVVRLVSAVVQCHRYCIRWRDIRRRTRLARTASEGGMKSELHRYEKDGMPNPV